MAALMAAGMVAPLAMASATFVRKQLVTVPVGTVGTVGTVVTTGIVVLLEGLRPNPLLRAERAAEAVVPVAQPAAA